MRTKRRSRFAFTAIFVGAALLGACGTETTGMNEEPSTDLDQVRSELARNTNPAPSSQSMSALSEGNHRLTLDLFWAGVESGQNGMISTLSIRSAFAMLYEGARGITGQEMADVLYFDTDKSVLHTAMNALDLALEGRALEPSSDQGAVKVSIANAYWGQAGLSWQPDFLDTLAVNYGAGIYALDFAEQPEVSRQRINQWVENKTNNKIKDLIPEGSIKRDTLNVLTNAIYFQAPWASPFLDIGAKRDGFTRLDGSTVSPKMMNSISRLKYAEEEGWTAVELPYRGRELSMVLIVPDHQTYTEFEAGIDVAQLAAITDVMQPAQVELTLPKFSFETEMGLKNVLSSLGMATAFSNGADFGGILEGGGLKVDEAFHKTFVAIDEQGTEAAAATAIIGVPTSVPQIDYSLEVDRPFLFLIRDLETDVWLFFGRVVDPG